MISSFWSSSYSLAIAYMLFSFGRSYFILVVLGVSYLGVKEYEGGFIGFIAIKRKKREKSLGSDKINYWMEYKYFS